MHPRRTTLLAYDAGALGARRARRVADHLAECVRCRQALVRHRELRTAATEVTSPPAPDVLASILTRLDSGESLLLPDPDLVGSGREPRTGRVALAAAVTLLVVAGSAVAAAGVLDLGPLTRWVGLDDPVVEAPAPARPDRTVSGVEVEVPPSGVRILLEEVEDAVTLVVTRTEGRLLEVTGVGVASEAAFRVGEGQVTVRGAAGGELRLGVPRGMVGMVRVAVGSQLLAVVEDGRVRLRGRDPAPAARMTIGDLRTGGGS